MEMKLWKAAAGHTVWPENRCRKNRRTEYTIQIKVLKPKSHYTYHLV
jgi:hypothetical protein